MDAADLERELRALRDAVQRLLVDLERIAKIDDDADRGRELRRAWRAQTLLLVKPPKSLLVKPPKK